MTKSKIDNFSKSFGQYIKKDKFLLICLFVILILAFSLRFWDYFDRVSLGGDNARDAIVGKYSAVNIKPAQIGQFSSAGPFFYAPWYYWYLSLLSLIPLGVLTPWFFNTFVNIIFVILIFFLGKELGSKFLGLVAALFATISPLLIGNSLSLWNVSSVPILVLISLILFIKFLKTSKPLFMFFLSFVIFLSWVIHFQNILIFPTIPTALLFTKNRAHLIQCVLLAVLGAFIALLPLIYFDLRFGWYNFRSILIYLLIDQNKVWYPNRWLTYIFDYWPEAIRLIIGGNRYLVFFNLFLLLVVIIKKLNKIKSNKVFLAFVLLLAIEVLLFRYYRGVRHIYLSLFSAPAIIILTAYVIEQVYRFKKLLGVLLLATICIFTLLETRQTFSKQHLTYNHIRTYVNQIYKTLPDKKINLYSCSLEGSSFGYPVALFMYWDGKNSPGGENIGVCGGADGPGDLSWQILAPDEIKPGFWYRKNAKDVYTDTVEWWKTSPPPGGNDFFEFLKVKLSPKCYPNC